MTDHAGTPQELCSENGEVVWQGEQALWGYYQQQHLLPYRGSREEAINDALYCDLRYQGQIEDRESGLYYNVNRYYDADSGQYLSPDPIGFAGGLRPQAYVHNPLEWVDPLGLAGAAHGGGDVAKKAGYGPNDPPVRIEGDWSVNDMKAALLGHPPKGLGKPDLHHADQMPGSAIHEILPELHRGNKSLHPNKYNQGVTPEMRDADRKLHWWYRAREQGADDALPNWIYN
ncbi:RHS repeat-associated core domain-containing protein [Vibrio metschnikovii]|uniref:RHS repeat domain-containing protein n=1 Tax=Vibrio metschnikovii TaxID=28172 RepID=UPI002FCA4794